MDNLCLNNSSSVDDINSIECEITQEQHDFLIPEQIAQSMSPGLNISAFCEVTKFRNHPFGVPETQLQDNSPEFGILSGRDITPNLEA